MKRCSIGLLILLLLYLATGFYIVGGNQKAVVRRFGRIVKTPAGGVALKDSGLHLDLPWPWTQVDRVNLNEVRTLTLGAAEIENFEDEDLLQSVDSSRQSQFLTGDKNILHLQVVAQYRISRLHPDDFLFRSESARRRLKLLVEAATAEMVSRSGVDFVHPLGLSQLRDLLTTRVRELARAHDLGIEVDEVSISGVAPPVQVKSYFLDVSNARAEMDKYINEARAYAEQKIATADAEAQKIVDEAESYRDDVVSSAEGRADSFLAMVKQFRRDEQQGIQSYRQARRMALHRRYMEVTEEVMQKAAGKVFLDSGQQVDLSLFRDPQE